MIIISGPRLGSCNADPSMQILQYCLAKVGKRLYQFDTVVHDSSHCKTFDGNLVPKVIVIDGVLCLNY